MHDEEDTQRRRCSRRVREPAAGHGPAQSKEAQRLETHQVPGASEVPGTWWAILRTVVADLLPLLIALGLFLACASYQLSLPGLHYDEAKEAGLTPPPNS